MVMVMGVLGFVMFILVVFFGYEWFGDSGEKIVVLLGVLLIVFGYLCNYVFCK